MPYVSISRETNRPAAHKSASCLRISMSLMVVMARESARAIVVIRDLHASAPAQLIARKPLHECELAHLPAKRSAEDADVSAGSLALLRPFARSEFGIVLDGFAVDILQVE